MNIFDGFQKIRMYGNKEIIGVFQFRIFSRLTLFYFIPFEQNKFIQSLDLSLLNFTFGTSLKHIKQHKRFFKFNFRFIEK